MESSPKWGRRLYTHKRLVSDQVITTVYPDAYLGRSAVGKTSVIRVRCSDSDGEPIGDYFLKTNAALEDFDSDPCRELVSSKLAQFFEIPTPEVVIVDLNPDFAALVPPEDEALRFLIQSSSGPNFATKWLGPGGRIFPPRLPIPPHLGQLALDIFALDGLLRNPDRLPSGPNLWWGRGSFYVIDHDEAFTDLTLEPLPPNSLTLKHLRGHLFQQGLKRSGLSVEKFASRLAALTDDELSDIVAELPDEWHNEYLERILAHLRLWRSLPVDFAAAVQMMLA